MMLLSILLKICLVSQAMAKQATKRNMANEINTLRHEFSEFRSYTKEKIQMQEEESRKLHEIISAQQKLLQNYECASSHVSKVKTNEIYPITTATNSNLRVSGSTYRRENRFMAFGCLAQDIHLSCDGDRTINITSAFYGQYHEVCNNTCCVPHPNDECWENMETSRVSDWLALKYLCGNQTSCEYEYRGSTFVNSCTMGNMADFLEIYYNCLAEPIDEPVAFSAQPSEKRDYKDRDQLLFDRLKLNIGGHYQADASRFICPYDGLYMFSVTLLSRRYGDQIYGTIIVEELWLGTALGDETTDSLSQGSLTVVAECFAGQRVWLRTSNYGSLFDGNFSVFSGYLLYKYS